MDKQREFQRRILATFKLEAEENIEIINHDLLALENNILADNEEVLEELYRSAHSLKGAARAVGEADIESLCHAFEDVLSALREGEIKLSSENVDLFFYASDLLEKLLNNLDQETDSKTEEELNQLIDLLNLAELGEAFELPQKPKQKNFVQDTASVISPKTSTKETSKADEKPLEETNRRKSNKNRSKKDTIRLSTKKIEGLVTQVEELLPLKLGAQHKADELQKLIFKFSGWKKESFINLENQELFLKKEHADGDSGQHHFFSETLKKRFTEFESELFSILDQANREAAEAKQKIELLNSEVREMLSVPFSILLDTFPKMMHDLAKDLGKKITFSIVGQEIEIDRRILDELKDPLIHLLRNAVDYGIEFPDERKKKGKSDKGEIRIQVETLENNNVSLLISDDGPGLNFKKLKELYLKNETTSENDVSNTELAQYIFKSGVSTSEMVTDISGRGLGMSIVRQKIEDLGGSVLVKSEPEKGTLFSIKLPSKIVTFRGVVVTAGEQNFVIPTVKIQQIIKTKSQDLKTLNNQKVLNLNNEHILLVSLAKVLELQAKPLENENRLALVVDFSGKKIAFLVDEVLGEQEILVKNFNPQLKRVRNIMGATVLGINNLTPVLNIPDLFSSVERNKNSENYLIETKKVDKKKNLVLIVEDSITSRTLLKNIIQNAGYDTETAINGLEGFEKIKNLHPDVVISDVEMPLMDGFELTKKVKQSPGLKQTPIILVTSLAKKEHREKGVEVGANAYIVKTNFEQNNLLETIQRYV